MSKEDSEKRFESIMSKLFQSPKRSSLSSPSSVAGGYMFRGAPRNLKHWDDELYAIRGKFPDYLLDKDFPVPSSFSGNFKDRNVELPAPRVKELSDMGVFFKVNSGGVQPNIKRLKLVLAPGPELNSREDSIEGGFGHSYILSGSHAPLCRPWDRGDLMRRLATFKSMTWFGKPKAVSPINCACRGWVNVELDIIACEACRSRLLFSTPSSWTQQQVEKAAAVFSLKLDSGHKPLCPWINNSCDETLAQFPPTPAPVLAKNYNERCAALMQLSALPLVSPSAIDHMRSPQLERFLFQSPYQPHNVAQPGSSSQSKELVTESECGSANLYHQALKLISLCGWEPQLLPYTVDCEDPTSHSVVVRSSDMSSQVVSRHKPSVVVCSSTPSEKDAHAEEGPIRGCKYDPSSVVLNCRLCGARVGLWAFTNILRPLEFFRITNCVEINGQNNSTTTDTDVANQTHLGAFSGTTTCYNGSPMSGGKSLNLSLSIGGGPTPTKQKYKAIVSLPIISRHLRADVSATTDVGNCEPSENNSSDSQSITSLNCGKTDNIDHTTLSKHVEALDSVSGGSKNSTQSPVNMEIEEVHNAPGNEVNNGEHSNDVEIPPEGPSHHMQNISENSGMTDSLPLDVEITEVHASSEPDTGSHVQECTTTTTDSNGTIEDAKSIEKHSLGSSPKPWNQRVEFPNSMKHPINCKQIHRDGHFDSTSVSSFLQANVTGSCICNTGLEINERGSHFQSPSSVGLDHQNIGVKETVHSSDGSRNFGASKTHSDLRLMRLDNKMEFDPVRQHRHFCPWISSAGASLPGWRLTLSALCQAKNLPHTPNIDSSVTSSYKDDDPITSVRKLFMSPSQKRMSVSHESK